MPYFLKKKGDKSIEKILLFFYMEITSKKDIDTLTKGVSKKYKDYFRKYGTAYITAASFKAEQLIAERATTAIELYYERYNPSYYVRTDNLRTKSMGGFRLLHKPYKEYKTKNKMFSEGGIRLGSKFLNPYPIRGISMDSIYYRTWYNGEHGREKLNDGNGNTIWRPIYSNPYFTPYDYVKDYIDNSIDLRNKCSKAGFSAANKVKLI